MDAHTIRRLNLGAIATQFSRSALANKLGYPNEGYINGCINGANTIGPNAPRKWEGILGLDKGWFDVPHPKVWDDAKIDEFQAIKAVQTDIRSESDDLTPQESAAVIAYIHLLKSQRS